MHKSKIRIAVSGAGGGVGQSIIKSLQNTNYEVVALDGEPLAAGLYAASKSYIIPYSDKPNYIQEVLKICAQEKCQLFFPGLDAELPILSENKEKFDEIGCVLVVSARDVIEIGNNKMTTFIELTKAGVRVPQTFDMSDTVLEDLPLSYPYILKQREGGARSQNLYLIESRSYIDNLIADGVDIGEHIAQEYIEGDEYTCGSVNLNGECKGVIVMRRILRDGDTYKCFSVKDGYIEEQVRMVANAIKPFGGCNVQLRMKDGVAYIFEINARCSGTTAARTLCGFNEPKMIADYICHEIEPTYEITEQTILRYWKEFVVPNDKIDKMKTIGFSENEEHMLL